MRFARAARGEGGRPLWWRPGNVMVRGAWPGIHPRGLAGTPGLCVPTYARDEERPTARVTRREPAGQGPRGGPRSCATRKSSRPAALSLSDRSPLSRPLFFRPASLPSYLFFRCRFFFLFASSHLPEIAASLRQFCALRFVRTRGSIPRHCSRHSFRRFGQIDKSLLRNVEDRRKYKLPTVGSMEYQMKKDTEGGRIILDASDIFCLEEVYEE